MIQLEKLYETYFKYLKLTKQYVRDIGQDADQGGIYQQSC